MRKSSSLLLTAFLFSAFSATAGTFTDGFESPVIDPFWNVFGPGSALLQTSTIHNGSQALKTATSSTFPWFVTLDHNYG